MIGEKNYNTRPSNELGVIEKEKGKNVEIVLHIMRHGDRDLDGNLRDYGRERTEKYAGFSHLKEEEFDIVKAIGSNAGPTAEVDGEKMQRSLETAHIFAKNISDNKNYKTRSRGLLSYEGLRSSLPYDHKKVYDSYIDEYVKNTLLIDEGINGFKDLSKEKKEAAASFADNKTVAHFMAMDTPQAKQLKREIAGSFAVLIERFAKMAREKLQSNQKILYPVGSHTGMMELLLSEAMVRTDDDGKKIVGGALDDFGGSFSPSEGFRCADKNK